MNRGSSLIKAYERLNDNVDIVDMNVQQLCGYYLKNYPIDTFGMLHEDVVNFRVPKTVANAAEIILRAIRR